MLNLRRENNNEGTGRVCMYVGGKKRWTGFRILNGSNDMTTRPTQKCLLLGGVSHDEPDAGLPMAGPAGTATVARPRL
jgi:hypothetical protein